MIGLGGIAPALTRSHRLLQPCPWLPITVSGWGQERPPAVPSTCVRRARISVPTSVRRAGVRRDIREARQESRAKYREARKALRVEFWAARAVSGKRSNRPMRPSDDRPGQPGDVVECREQPGLDPRAATGRRMTYRTEVKAGPPGPSDRYQGRDRRLPIRAQGRPCRVQGRHRQVVQHEPPPAWHPSGQAGVGACWGCLPTAGRGMTAATTK